MTEPLYPAFFKLQGKPILVVGGGPVALRRVDRLLEAGARVTVVSPSLVQGLQARRDEGRIRWVARPFIIEDLDGPFWVFVAAGDRGLARRIREEAARSRLPLNVADDEALSDFHVPAVLSQDGVEVAVSSGGRSPAGAAAVRDRMAAWLASERGFLADALGRGRTPAGDAAPAEKARGGTVYIVGAGPGDPGLLTVRAARLLSTADIVYHDRLVSGAILETIPGRVEKVYVGKEAGCARRAEIHDLLVRSARAGKAVVRLKGGDPLVFGRGGEEILHLRQEGIEFEVVPGVSALSAVPAAAGIPVTYRGVAGEIVVRSGHHLEAAPAPGPAATPEPALPWRRAPGGLEADRALRATYVYFMAASRLPQVVQELLSEGLPGSTPVAVIQKGTLPDQRVLISRLAELTGLLEQEVIETPALLVAGEVVKFRDLKEFLALAAGQAAASAEQLSASNP